MEFPLEFVIKLCSSDNGLDALQKLTCIPKGDRKLVYLAFEKKTGLGGNLIESLKVRQNLSLEVENFIKNRRKQDNEIRKLYTSTMRIELKLKGSVQQILKSAIENLVECQDFDYMYLSYSYLNSLQNVTTSNASKFSDIMVIVSTPWNNLSDFAEDDEFRMSNFFTPKPMEDRKSSVGDIEIEKKSKKKIKNKKKKKKRATKLASKA